MIASITDIATQIYANPAERERLLALIEKEGRLDNQELQVRRKDGSVMWILTSLRAVHDGAGKVLYYDGTNIDVTERKRISALETTTLRAEAASRAKSAFLANMSHEIRTPMNAILGFSQLLMRDPDLSPAQREHLRVIDRNGEHLMALITDILEMSKIEANRATLNRSAFVLVGLARDLESMFRARIVAQGLTFVIEIDESSRERLVGDVGKLRQIFVNLLANAVKFTATGRIVLRLHAEPQLDGSWCLRGEVEDTGPGIPPDFIGQLFDEFAQTELGRLMGAGTGLGLPISREFARMMDGDITVESREGQGSVFRVTVILSRAATGQPADLDQRNGLGDDFVRLAPDQPERRVLVVDDQADSRQFLRLLLTGAGFVVREATNGAEAVTTAASWKPHCILMDLRMPVMGGLEAIVEIRRHDDGRAIKIISLTASVFVEDRAQVLAAGADRFMTKPVHVSDLFEQMGVLLELSYVRTGPVEMAGHGQGTLVADRAAIRVPALWIERLRAAVESADLDLLLALTDELATVDGPAAGEIRRMVNRFDYPALLALLDASTEANA
jgi:signal transduction histidine kinase/DNA-binding response OmpR family regulator